MASFSALFERRKLRQEVYSDVISDVFVNPTGVEVRVKFGDAIRLPHFVTNDNGDAGRRTLYDNRANAV